MYLVNQYDAIAEKYDSLFVDKESVKENEKVSSMLSNVHTPIMDIGCGTGLLIDLLNVQESDYIGVDPSRKMLSVFHRKHPGYKLLNIPFEWLDSNEVDYDTAVALFGSASYIRFDSLKRMPHDKGIFLMFYKEDYHPVTYVRTGCELEHYVYSKNELRELFPSCRIKEFGNYNIVTNL